MKFEKYILDSYAVLAYLENSAGADFIEDLLRRAEANHCELYLSMINFGEVVYIIERHRGLGRAQEIIARLDELPVTMVEAGRFSVLNAAHIKANFAIAYADCFAVVLAQIWEAPVVTGDPEFKCLEEAGLIKVHWLT